MNIVKCEHGHFYDSEQYQTCPFCESRESNQIEIRGQKGPIDPGIIVGYNEHFIDVDPVKCKVCAFCGERYSSSNYKSPDYEMFKYCDCCYARLIDSEKGLGINSDVTISFIFSNGRVRLLRFKEMAVGIREMLSKIYKCHKKGALYCKEESNALVLRCFDGPIREGYMRLSSDIVRRGYNHIIYPEKIGVFIFKEELIMNDCSRSECAYILDWLLEHDVSDVRLMQKP